MLLLVLLQMILVLRHLHHRLLLLANIMHSSSDAFNILQKFASACMNLKEYNGALNAQCLNIVSKPTTSTSIEGSLVTSDARIDIILNKVAHIHFTEGDMWKAILLLNKYCLDYQLSFTERSV